MLIGKAEAVTLTFLSLLLTLTAAALVDGKSLGDAFTKAIGVMSYLCPIICGCLLTSLAVHNVSVFCRRRFGRRS